MIIDVMTGKTLNMPRLKDFNVLRSRLSGDELDAIVNRINELIDEAGGKIATAGWLPGNDWTGTPFQAIYVKGARGDYDVSAKFFGLLVWHAVMERDETWGTGKYQVDGRDIGSRTYFIVGGSA